jgi:elongation factor Ts
MAIDPKLVMKLRAETGAGAMDCKKALEESGGDYDKAKALINKRGLARAEKLGGREATVGAIGTYVHGGRIGAMVELACNTDFVTRNEQFQELLKRIAVAVCGFNPKYVSKEQVPAEIVAEERKKFEGDVKGKPPEIAEKIIGGKMDKNFFSQSCLLSMAVDGDDKNGTYGDLVKAMSGKIGENIVVRRFVRMELGT